MPEEEKVNPEVVEAMGISQPAFEEIQHILGHLPSIEELSTLLALWESNGKQQSLYGWLKCQPHSYIANDYVYTGDDTQHKEIREPRVKDCLNIAQTLCAESDQKSKHPFVAHGDLLYMVGNVASDFLDSDYSRKYLHLADNPIHMNSPEEEIDYIRMVLESLFENKVLNSIEEVNRGGLFGALSNSSLGKFGFDILTCREVRLDAFLFGEKPGRMIVSLPETQDDFFLLKMDDARLNCCFLGRITKGRVIVDGMDFGDVSEFHVR